MYVLGINGSPKPNGNTFYLLQELFDKIKIHNHETEIVNMNEILKQVKNPFCVDCMSPCTGACYKDTRLDELFDKMRRADVIVMGSPVYFGAPTAQLKCLFDKGRKIRAEKGLVGTYGAAIAVGDSKYGGQEVTLRTIHDCMLVMGMTIIADGAEEFDAGHFGVAAQKPAVDDAFAQKRIEVLAQRILFDINK